MIARAPVFRPQRASARTQFRRSLVRESRRDAPPLLLARRRTRPARRSTPPLPRTVVRDVTRPGGCMARPDRIQPWMCDREHLARPGGGRWPSGKDCGTYEALAAPVLWAGPRGLSTGELQRRRTRTLISGSAFCAGGGDYGPPNQLSEARDDARGGLPVRGSSGSNSTRRALSRMQTAQAAWL